jgi:hypothetical protein
MFRTACTVLLCAAGLASPAAAEVLSCQGSGLSLTVDIDAPAGRCSVDGQTASMKRAYNPVVCHVADAQLIILTIGADGGFIWEDTSSNRVVRGTCSRA